MTALRIELVVESSNMSLISRGARPCKCLITFRIHRRCNDIDRAYDALRQVSMDQAPLDYRSPTVVVPRRGWLAVVAFVLSLLSCPCIFRAIFSPSMIGRLPDPIRRNFDTSMYYIPPSLALCVAGWALLSAWRHKHRCSLAVAAIVVSSVWILALLALRSISIPVPSPN